MTGPICPTCHNTMISVDTSGRPAFSFCEFCLPGILRCVLTDHEDSPDCPDCRIPCELVGADIPAWLCPDCRSVVSR